MHTEYDENLFVSYDTVEGCSQDAVEKGDQGMAE